MHGRLRNADSKPEEEAVKTLELQSLLWLQPQVISNHHQKIYTEEAIQLSAKLLEINPEAYTAWNYRKLAVLSRIDDSDPSLINSILNEELEVVANVLRRNLKSYGAWYHRKWVLSRWHNYYSSLEKELQLLNTNQKPDLRNFHAWNYRREMFSNNMKNNHVNPISLYQDIDLG